MFNRIKKCLLTDQSERGNDRKNTQKHFIPLNKDTKKLYLLKALFHKMKKHSYLLVLCW
jgi:hypothetical protein